MRGKAIATATSDFDCELQEFWSKKYGHSISEEEAKEIQRNLFGYFKLLGKWQRESVGNQLEPARPNEVGSPA